MDILWIILGLILLIVGIIGCIIPGLPGPMSAWTGLLLTSFAQTVNIDNSLLIITFIVAAGISILDYFIPAIGTKKFGGSKYGTYGSIIGLIVGIFVPIPGGILAGLFLGAFIGEYLKNNDTSKATKSAFGAFIGFLLSTGMQLTVSIVFFVLYFRILSENWSEIVKIF